MPNNTYKTQYYYRNSISKPAITVAGFIALIVVYLAFLPIKTVHQYIKNYKTNNDQKNQRLITPNFSDNLTKDSQKTILKLVSCKTVNIKTFIKKHL